MDCREVTELLDAYAIGAVEAGESQAIGDHIADCLRCWGELNKAQRTAALIALSVPIQEAPPRLEQRIMADARRDKGQRPEPRAAGPFWRRLRWQTASMGLAAVSVGALAFAGFLQWQVNDVRDDKSALATQVDQQRQVLAIVSAADAQKLPMSKRSLQGDASVSYTWSSTVHMGFLSCQNLPAPEAGQVYEVWFQTDGTSHPAGSFVPDNGSCALTMDLSWLDSRPDGIGLTVEPAPGATGQHSGWQMYASFIGE